MFKKMVIVGFFGIIVLVNRDKLGTTFWDNWLTSAESALFIGFDKAGENQAERAGFPEGHSVSPCVNWVCIFKSFC